MKGILKFILASMIIMITIASGCIYFIGDFGNKSNINDPSEPAQELINTTMFKNFKYSINTVIYNYTIVFCEHVDIYFQEKNEKYQYYYGIIFNTYHSIILYYNYNNDTFHVSQEFVPETANETKAYEIITTISSEPEVVPTSIEHLQESEYKVGYHDGWCHGCNHSSFGFAEVNVTSNSYEFTIHVE